MACISPIFPLLLLGAEPLARGDHSIEVDVHGESREAIVHVPSSYDGQQPIPLVLCFHGSASNARQQMRYSGLNAKADEAGFIVVYPYGTGRVSAFRSWNAGNCCGYAQRKDIDELAFVKTLLDELESRANIDARRIYATGISNGGMLSYHLASEMSDRIAAIASVAGPMGYESCSPSRPVPILHFHGTTDTIVNIDGGPGNQRVANTEFYSLAHTISSWVDANGCDAAPVMTEMPDASDDGMRVERDTYGNGREGAEIVLYRIIGGGHTWPGRQFLTSVLGPSTMDISANDIIWDFFVKHPMPE